MAINNTLLKAILTALITILSALSNNLVSEAK